MKNSLSFVSNAKFITQTMLNVRTVVISHFIRPVLITLNTSRKMRYFVR